MPARMNLLLDAPDQEFWLDETNRGTTIVPGLRQRLHLGDDQPPRRVQRALHPQPRQPLRQGQLPAARDPPPDDAGADLRGRAEHRRRAAAEPAAGALRLPGRSAAAQALADAQAARALGRAGDERQHAQLLRPLRRAGRGALHGQRLRHLPRGGRGAPAGHRHQRLEPQPGRPGASTRC